MARIGYMADNTKTTKKAPAKKAPAKKAAATKASSATKKAPAKKAAAKKVAEPNPYEVFNTPEAPKKRSLLRRIFRRK